ncbi:MAG TPA: glycine cleavage system aminomethyltransferase GcvT [Planctomycetota bacterium]|jgi:aminomethyltransferase|nr:glycine cleavage system aminomethyltransferase GcvT [Planctomycetota bacterium]
MKETPLHDVHAALGAKMVEFGGWHMPVQYGPILDEVRTVRTKAGLFDLSHMGRVRVTGDDRVRFVDRIATNFCAKIPEGAIRYGLFCREDGNPIDDLLVYRGKDEVFLVVNASNTAVDLAWMREHAGEFRVAIEDQTDALAMIALQGQESQAVLQPLVPDLDLASVGYYRFGFGTLCGLPGTRVSRTGYTGEDGFEVYVPAAEATRVWDALVRAGAPRGVRPIGLGARDTLRLEAGMPLYGHEIDAEHNPIEAGLAFGVSFHPDKGDWIGRAALERVQKAPKRKLVGIKSAGPRVPRQGYALFDGSRELGAVCSGSPSPTLDTNIGTAYVPLDSGAIGGRVEIDIKGKRQKAQFCALPFFSRTRK